MKVSILFWAFVCVLVLVGIAFLLATRTTVSQPGQISRVDLQAFADRMDGKLSQLQQKYDSIQRVRATTPQQNSARLQFEQQLDRCRVLVDSVRQSSTADGKGLLDRLAEAYSEAKQSLDALGQPAGPVR